MRVRAIAPALLSLGLGVLALGPALGLGFVLTYDMVFVPDPPLSREGFGLGGGFPRAVPSDAVVALLSSIIPAAAVQKLILLAVFVLAGSGAAALLPKDRLGGRLAAAAFYVWNAYLAQRLLIGQWALLLGYAGLPWALRAAMRSDARRLAFALLPAAVGGFAAMLISGLVVISTAATRGVRIAAGSIGVLVALSLPWLVPALLSGATTDPAGAVAFAPRPDGPFGTVGSLLTLGGIWNAEAVLPDQGDAILAFLRLILAVVAIAGFVRLARADRAFTGLGIAAAAGLALALAGAAWPGMIRSLIEFWPGFGPLRDGQVYVAPLALLQALGVGSLVAETSARLRLWLVVIPVIVLPTFAWGAFGRLQATEYPGEWQQVQSIVAADRAPGAVLVLPWGAYRRFDWNDRPVLDPAVKLFPRRVIWNDGFTVTRPDGREIQLRPEDPLTRRLDEIVRADIRPIVNDLREAGIHYVLIDYEPSVNQNTLLSRLSGAQRVFAGRDLVLYRIHRAMDIEVTRWYMALVSCGWMITVSVSIWSFAGSGSSLVPLPFRGSGSAPG